MQTKTPVTPSAVEIPEDIICPITSHIMTDPVILVESGNTYEREAILTWLKTKKTDPLTNEVISDVTIAPNRTVKRMIQTFLDKQRALNADISHQTYLPESMVQTLISAVEKNDLPLFKETLKKDNRLLFNELKEKKNIFMLACELGSLEILEMVVGALGDKIKQLGSVQTDNGLSVFLSVGGRLGLKGAACISKAMSWKPSNFQSVLVASAAQNDAVMTEIALSLGAIATPELLHQATAEKKTAIVKLLILSGVSIETEDEQGNDLLMRTIHTNDTPLTLFLLSECAAKVNVNRLNKGKDTALMLAVQKGQLDMVKALLDHPKINLQQTNAQKDTVLHVAVRNRDQKMVDLWIEKKISLDEKNAQAQTALDMAYDCYDKTDFGLLKSLVLAGSKRDDLLLNAIEKNQEELIEFLLTEGKALVNPNLADSKGQTPLMVAVQKNQPKTVSLLLTQRNLNLSQVDAQGNTALHYAAMQGNNDLIKLLMKQHASIKAKNKARKTPFQLARENGYQELANWMEEKHRYKKVKPFLKPLEVENQKLREELAALKTNVATQKTNWEKFSMFSEGDAKLLTTMVAERRGYAKRQEEAQKAQNQLIEAWFNGDLALVKQLESQGASLFTVNKEVRTYVQQVKAMFKSVQSKINPQELSALLKWVTEGHLVEVETLLKKSPILALGTGTVTDLSDRTFANITALQYAAWAYDIEMCELIMTYLPPHNASIQLKALSNEPMLYSVHGANYDMSPLITKTNTYVDNCSNWKYDKRCHYWQKEVGGEQRKCPAWLIYAWTEEENDVAWTKQDATRKIKREYDKNNLVEWISVVGKDGVDCIGPVCRGNDKGGTIAGGLVNVFTFVATSNEYPECHSYPVWNTLMLELDVMSLLNFRKFCMESMERLKTAVDNQLVNSSIGFGKGQ